MVLPGPINPWKVPEYRRFAPDRDLGEAQSFEGQDHSEKPHNGFNVMPAGISLQFQVLFGQKRRRRLSPRQDGLLYIL